MTTIIPQILAAGYRVFVRNGGDTYAYFTDGNDIGYIENAWRGVTISTVHIPNHDTGTGFGMGSVSAISRETLSAAFTHAPHWARESDRQSVRKYRSIESFLKANNWGGGLHEVAEVVEASK
jgi:hypothetical protein